MKRTKSTFDRNVMPPLTYFVGMRILFFTLSMVLVMVYGSAQPAEPEATPVLSIDKITLDEPGNSIQIHASFTNIRHVDTLLKNKTKLRLGIAQGNRTFNDVIIKTIESLAGEKLLLTVQPPLNDAIYRTEKRDFALELTSDGKTYTVHKNGILGFPTKTFDLRPYTQTDHSGLLIKALVIVSLFSLILVMVPRLYRKYRFKKRHIKNYAVIRREGESHQDPFTFVEIQDTDEVVVVDDGIMLLSSWKKLKRLPESPPAKEFAAFFTQTRPGSFFRPQTDNYVRANRAWYGLMGVFAGWILYITLSAVGATGHLQFLAPLFDGHQNQVSTIIVHDSLLGLIIGIAYTLALGIAFGLYVRDRKAIRKRTGVLSIRALLIAFAFFLQAVLTAYLIHNPYINGGITWLMVGLAFVVPLDFKSDIKKKIGTGLGIAALSYLTYQILNINYALDVFGTDIPLLLSLAVMGSISAYISYPEITEYALPRIPWKRFMADTANEILDTEEIPESPKEKNKLPKEDTAVL